jgi:hypothetical protein
MHRKINFKNRKWHWLCAIGLAFTFCGAPAESQERVKAPRIGVLFPGFPTSFALCTKAFLKVSASWITSREKP